MRRLLLALSAAALLASPVADADLATALLDTIFAAFAERGETEVRLKVRADNLAARRAYEKAGFTPAAFV